MKHKLFFLLFGLAWAGQVSAHQPRLVSGPETVVVENPEISQAFYGELSGQPHTYRIVSSTPFRLYVGLLVPDLPGAPTDLSVAILKADARREEPVAFLDGSRFDWTPFYEEFAGDDYLWGPEFKAADSQTGKALKVETVPAGEYRIRVSSTSNRGKYSLAIGDVESFPLGETLNALVLVPQVKVKFFGWSWLQVLLSRFGLIWAAVIGLSTLILYLIFRLVRSLRRRKETSPSR